MDYYYYYVLQRDKLNAVKIDENKCSKTEPAVEIEKTAVVLTLKNEVGGLLQDLKIFKVSFQIYFYSFHLKKKKKKVKAQSCNKHLLL